MEGVGVIVSGLHLLATRPRRNSIGISDVSVCQVLLCKLDKTLIAGAISELCYKLALDNEVLEMTMQEMKDDYKKQIRELTPPPLSG